MKPISELLMTSFNVTEGYQLIEKITDQLSEQAIVVCFQGLNQMIETTERQISEKNRMKINLLDRMKA